MAIITIGREFGSSGHEIGEIISKKLNIPFYAKEVLDIASDESGLCREVFENNDEKAGISTLFGGTSHIASLNGGVNFGVSLPLSQQVFLAQFETLTKLAQNGDCVIVGRCSNYVLKDFPNAVHIFLYADLENRVKRIMYIKNLDEDKARELVRKTDKQRKTYYNFFANGTWGERSSYSMMLCTDHLTPEAAADLIIDYVNKRG